MVSTAKKSITGSCIGDFLLRKVAAANLPDDEVSQKWDELRHTYDIIEIVMKLKGCDSVIILYEPGPEVYQRSLRSDNGGEPTKALFVLVRHLKMKSMRYKIIEEFTGGITSKDKILEWAREGGFQDITEQAFPPLLH